MNLEDGNFRRSVKPIEVARTLGIPPKAVYRLIAEKRLLAFRVGRLLRIRVRDLDSFIAEAIERGTN